MSKTSDELREWVRHALADEHMDLRELDAIADRIDSELVELPKDSDGIPIHVGDTVWTAYKNTLEFTVMSITLHTNGVVNVDALCEGCHAHVGPSDLTHTRHDSFERIADELERYVNDSCSEYEIDGMTASTLVDFAGRIRKLAEKEGE